MIAVELMQEIKDFLDGKTDIETFSFDFETNLYNATDELKKENYALYDLLNEDMPELCANYEPDPEQRKAYPDTYFDEETVRKRVYEIYTSALPLMRKTKIS